MFAVIALGVCRCWKVIDKNLCDDRNEWWRCQGILNYHPLTLIFHWTTHNYRFHIYRQFPLHAKKIVKNIKADILHEKNPLQPSQFPLRWWKGFWRLFSLAPYQLTHLWQCLSPPSYILSCNTKCLALCLDNLPHIYPWFQLRTVKELHSTRGAYTLQHLEVYHNLCPCLETLWSALKLSTVKKITKLSDISSPINLRIAMKWPRLRWALQEEIAKTKKISLWSDFKCYYQSTE